jgi:hypothetical protein
MTTVIVNTPTQEVQLERKMMDWSKHPNKDKRDYFEVMYNNSSK